MFTKQHQELLNARRRISIQTDIWPSLEGLRQRNLEEIFQWVFWDLDQAGSQIDAVLWDTLYFLPQSEHAFTDWVEAWRQQGTDLMHLLLEETKKRGRTSFLNHRISEVERLADKGLELERRNRVKAEHPDWLIHTWWWQGLWNLAEPGLREYKVNLLQSWLQQYAFDGVQLDFSRHVPCLPPGKAWELRHHITEFMTQIRQMTLDVERKTGRPQLVWAKVPENEMGCRCDGFDVQAWVDAKAVDCLTVGCRSIDVDLAWFREITAGTNIKLYPCWDDWHASDGYRAPDISLFRGIFANWWQQGADGLVAFNWTNAPEWLCRKLQLPQEAIGPESQRQAYLEVGSQESLHRKNKVFPVQRRGGYPWAEGYFNRNDQAPLAVQLFGERPICLEVNVSDPVSQLDPDECTVILRLVLSGTVCGDQLSAAVNGLDVLQKDSDDQWQDGQIFSPQQIPSSGMSLDAYRPKPDQKLLRLDFAVPCGQVKRGQNIVQVRLCRTDSFRPGQNVWLEKVEVMLFYAE